MNNHNAEKSIYSEKGPAIILKELYKRRKIVDKSKESKTCITNNFEPSRILSFCSTNLRLCYRRIKLNQFCSFLPEIMQLVFVRLKEVNSAIGNSWL